MLSLGDLELGNLSIMIDAVLYRFRIGIFCGRMCRKGKRKRKDEYSRYCSPNSVFDNYLTVIYYIFILYTFISCASFGITLNGRPSRSLNLTSPKRNLSWVVDCIIILFTTVIRKFYSQTQLNHWDSGIGDILRHFRYSYSSGSHKVYRLFRRYIFWGVCLNTFLILISNMSLLNPGPTSTSHLTVYYQNVRGLIPFSELANPNPTLDVNKINELQLHVSSEKPDIVILNETWLKPSVFSNEVLPDSAYKVFRLDRSTGTHPRDPGNPGRYRANGGGVLIAIKHNIHADTKLIKIACKAEMLAVEFKFENGTKLCMGTCYRVGTLGEANRLEIANFLTNLLRVKKYSKFFLIGDFNLPGATADNWEEAATPDTCEQAFIDMFSDLNLKQVIRDPTHNKGKILDILLTNSYQSVSSVMILDENQVCKSDHYPICFKLLENIRRKKSPKRKLLNYNKAQWGPLNDEINSINWNILLAGNDVELSLTVFETKLNQLINKYIPTVTAKSEYQPPWFDAEVHVKCREKEKWRAKFKKSKSDEHYMKFSACRKEVTRLIKLKANANFEDDEHPNAVTKKFWSYVKTTSNSSRIPETVHYNNIFRSAPRDQADLFNCFFADQFTTPSNYNINIDYSRNFTIVFERSRISHYLKLLNVNKAPGPDKFHGKLLKNCAESLAVPLSILFNKSFSSGVIPKAWKVANVVPVFKKGSKNNVENYRPISLTSIIMKTYEKIVRDDLMNRCRDKISEHQHGFLPQRSCETQLIPYYDDLALSLNECSRTDIIYFDFAKAFDSVNHDIILNKLKIQFDIDGQLLKFFVSYLKGRVQRVVVGGEFSEAQSVLSGVPQGSILGPTLFVLFINDIGNEIDPMSTIKLYADDTKLYRKISKSNDHEVLQKDINSLNDWALRNKMKFHPNKCKVLSVSLKRTVENYIYKLGNMPITYVSSEKDLGVKFNSGLTWTDHCNFIYSKANRMLGLARRTCYFISNVSKKRSIYLALVRSQFEHCSPVWRPGNITSIMKIESIQKKAVKWILGKPIYNYSISSFEYFTICKELKLLSLELRFEFKDLKMLHDIINGRSVIKLPSYVSWFSGSRLRSSHLDSYCLVSGVQPRITRKYNIKTNCNYNNDRPDNTASSFSKFSNNYFYRALQSWNRLPLNIRIIEIRSLFLNKVEEHLWQVFYQSSCGEEQ